MKNLFFNNQISNLKDKLYEIVKQCVDNWQSLSFEEQRDKYIYFIKNMNKLTKFDCDYEGSPNHMRLENLFTIYIDNNQTKSLFNLLQQNDYQEIKKVMNHILDLSNMSELMIKEITQQFINLFENYIDYPYTLVVDDIEGKPLNENIVNWFINFKNTYLSQNNEIKSSKDIDFLNIFVENLKSFFIRNRITYIV